MCRLNWWVKSESSYLHSGNDVSSAVTDVDRYLLSYFLHRTMGPSALATPPSNSLCLLCESISSEPVVIMSTWVKFENWGAGCSAGCSLSPTRMCPIAVGLHRPHSLGLLVALLLWRKLASLPEEKRQFLFALNIKDNVMVNTANFNTELIPSLLFPWQFEWKANDVLPVNQKLDWMCLIPW